MSYDFAIWESDASTGEHDAAATFEELFARYLEADLVAPTAKIQTYSDALAARFPDDESEDTPWAAGGPSSNCSGPILYVAVRYSRADEVGVVAERLAQEHDLVFFDPQKAPRTPANGGEVTITTSRGTVALPDRWVSFLSQELRNFGGYVVVDRGRDHVFAQARNDNGTLTLEYRDGSPRQHYQVQGVDLGDVAEALSQWAENHRHFIDKHTWQRLTLWD
ncbi:hypothetical protein ACFV9C_43660 [Kribbella sp. NPDC059898]|uniref:hypothetical protein n=1 Tax=Kribbella sp. NPDC059898 TaxID=3346995 RepID=UPI00365CF2DA